MNTQKHDKRIEAYLGGFEEFSDAVRERYGEERVENLSSEAMISLYRGFLTALPDIEKAGAERTMIRRGQVDGIGNLPDIEKAEKSA